MKSAARMACVCYSAITQSLGAAPNRYLCSYFDGRPVVAGASAADATLIPQSKRILTAVYHGLYVHGEVT